jgi:hypothetical protein
MRVDSLLERNWSIAFHSELQDGLSDPKEKDVACNACIGFHQVFEAGDDKRKRDIWFISFAVWKFKYLPWNSSLSLPHLDPISSFFALTQFPGRYFAYWKDEMV